MFLQPKRYKYKKLKKCYLKNQMLETKLNKLNFGSSGLKILESIKMPASQLEMIRQIINRTMNRKGKLWISLFPVISVTSKPTENRMGKGKGNVSFWVIPIKAGTVLFELQGISKQESFLVFKKVQKKLSFKTKIVYR